jgi:hypothetical protein
LLLWDSNERILRAENEVAVAIERAEKEVAIERAEKEVAIERGEKNVAIERAEKNLAKAEKEKERGKKEKERGEKNVALEQIKTQEVMTTLDSLTRSNNAGNPRAVMEYCEAFVMSKLSPVIFVDKQKKEFPKQYKDLSRKEKWEAYFKDANGDGPSILKCIVKANPLWDKNPQKVAERLAFFYDSTSDLYHASSHQIEGDKDGTTIVIGEILPQLVNAVMCIGNGLGLKIEVKSSLAS